MLEAASSKHLTAGLILPVAVSGDPSKMAEEVTLKNILSQVLKFVQQDLPDLKMHLKLLQEKIGLPRRCPQDYKSSQS